MARVFESKQFRDIAKIHKALSNERRFMLLAFLSSQETPERFAVLDLEKRFKISYKLISRHLQILDNVNLVERVRRGRAVGYRVTVLGKTFLKVNH